MNLKTGSIYYRAMNTSIFFKRHKIVGFIWKWGESIKETSEIPFYKQR